MKIRRLVFPIFFLLFVTHLKAQTSGCPDPLAINYNSSATDNDGSCIYESSSVAPTSSFTLDGNFTETSGLLEWNNRLWTHNDSYDTNIYALDTIDGSLLETYPLTGTVNTDWEEITQDDNFLYVGDFGNNSNGNRTDLKILRIDKNSLLLPPVLIDTIYFSYSNQTNFTPTGNNKTDFDCESFLVSRDSIFLFTKQWNSNKSSLYSLPKTPGSYIAKLKSTYNVHGLITGATYLASKKLVVLSGYSNALQPFLYLLYDFSESDFFGGNKRKINLSLSFHQVEGIATSDGLKYYITNEYFAFPPFVYAPEKLHTINLNYFLHDYLNTIEPEPLVLNVDTSTVALSYEIGSREIILINSNTSWNLSTDVDWLELTPSSGKDGGGITITATSANIAATSRSATITLSGAGVSDGTIFVTQAGAPLSLSVSEIDLTLNSELAATGMFNIISNTDWTIINTADWLEVSSLSGFGNSTVTVTSKNANVNSVSRTTDLIIQGPGLGDKVVSVMQNTFGLTTEIDYGNTDIYNSSASTSNMRAIPVIISSDGMLSSISVYHNGGEGHLILGVYSDLSGHPSTLLGTTGIRSVNSTAGWQTVDLGDAVSVTSGETVWLAWLFENAVNVRYTAGTPGRAQSFSKWVGSIPTTFGTPSYTNYTYSLYCTVSTNQPLLKNAIIEDEIQTYEKEIIRYFPNPSNGQFFIRWQNQYESDLLVKIYDIQGKLIRNDKINPDLREFRIDLRNESKGLYLIEIIDTKNRKIIDRSNVSIL